MGGAARPNCRNEGVPGYRERTTRHIEQVVRPAGTQRAALDDLRAAASRAAETLRAACPPSMPLTPTARLDAIERQLNAMLGAVRIMRPELEKFYDLLSDEQKVRFNTMTAQKD